MQNHEGVALGRAVELAGVEVGATAFDGCFDGGEGFLVVLVGICRGEACEDCQGRVANSRTDCVCVLNIP